MKKKLLPALLALVMVLGLLPLAAFAALPSGWSVAPATLEETAKGAFATGKPSSEFQKLTLTEVAKNDWPANLSNASEESTFVYKASGEIAKVTGWTGYSESEKDGYFAAIKITGVDTGTEYTVGQNPADTGTVGDDKTIVALSNLATSTDGLKDNTFTLTEGGQRAMVITVGKDTNAKTIYVLFGEVKAVDSFEVTPEEPEVIAVAKSVFIVNDETSYNKLPQSYLKDYPFETYKDSAVPTFPWLVATYSRKSASALTYEVTKDDKAVTLPQDGTATPAKANDDAYIMWRIKDADGLNQTDPYGKYVVSIKLGDQTVKLGEVTFTAPVDPNPPVEDAIEGTVTGEGDEAVLKPAENDVKNKVDSELADTSKDKVEIVVVPASGEADKTEVPLNTGALTALENVTKPVVIDTPQGGVALPANTLVGKTGKDAAVTFKMNNTSTEDTVETYEVGFYKDAQEVEVKDLPASTITLTFKTSFAKDDKVVVSSGSTIVKATVGAGGVVTVTTTHLSEWTIRKEAAVDGGYVKFDATDGKQHLTPGYVYIANGKTTYGEVKQNDNYLVQVETTGGTILSLAVADAQGLKIPCNKTGKMSVWQIGSGSVNITNVTGTDIQDKQVIYQVNLATLAEVAAPGTP